MNDLHDILWNDVSEEIKDAKSMYWDGCHKIYLAMDDEQVALFAEYGYDHHEPNLELMKEWFEQSCWLKFVSAVYTDHKNPNAGFSQLIPQFAFDEDEEDKDDD